MLGAIKTAKISKWLEVDWQLYSLQIDYSISDDKVICKQVLKDEEYNYENPAIIRLATIEYPIKTPEVKALVSFRLFQHNKLENFPLSNGAKEAAELTQQLNGIKDKRYVQIDYNLATDEIISKTLRKGDRQIYADENILFIGFLQQPWTAQDIEDYVIWAITTKGELHDIRRI